MSLSVNVKKRLGSFNLDVAFEVERADETLALLGPSGCGKSMTLKCIAGIVTPDEGRIVLNERVLFDSKAHVNLRPQQRRVGYLFQNYALFPNMTVEQNVSCGILDGSREERAARVAEQVRAFRLEGLEGKRPAQLSGGQQQRVALARIMASRPELLLLDEPFSALDGYLRWQLELELTDTLRQFPGGSVYVSHNRDEVYRMCDTVCVVSGGRSEEKLSVPELFATPTTVAAALISGCKNVSAATVGEDGLLTCADWGVRLRTTLPVPAACDHVGIRAHYFAVEAVGADGEPAGENRVSCTVSRVIDNTFSTIVMLQAPGGGLLRYECEKDAWTALGNPQQVSVGIAPECVMPLAGDPA
ncbi:sulfate/molybdate ABC transporter ATP-binding protein [Paratractidigestivibacter sp.]|uniref:sulfate/molybdate ABC transporter ATP-binding protein n=1 Tax=Paratractidigestivibacter sp. TaxID=2847316 RepID=UPI002ABD9FF8|nr:ATP-binding cassette domain-containing protein [Paratractidigestivibacter sp.]